MTNGSYLGWANNPILREQYLFICLDGMAIAIAALVLNIWHPGFCFPKEHQNPEVTSEKLRNASGGGVEAQV